MVFPIAVGTGPRHSSSRPFPAHAALQNGSVGRSRCDDSIMVVGTNADETLNATVFVSYHLLPVRDDGASITNGGEAFPNHAGAGGGTFDGGDSSLGETSVDPSHSSKSATALDVQLQRESHFNVIAELRVQITPATSPFVSNVDAMSSRETKSRVPLGIMRKKMRTVRSTTAATHYAPNASIEFSPNETHLACLIPLPIEYELISYTPGSRIDDNSPLSQLHRVDTNGPASTIVIFRIQAKNVTSQQRLEQRKKRNLPKLPDYIVESSMDEGKEEMENAAEKRDHADFEEDEPPISSSSSRGLSVSYVAHDPKIVRVPLPTLSEHNTVLDPGANTNGAKPNRSFLRQLSGGSGNAVAPVMTPTTLRCATCMCSLPADHHRGKSSSAFSVLLVGTVDGTLMLVDFVLARVRSVIPQRNISGGQQNDDLLSAELNLNPIVHLSQCTPTHWKQLDLYGEEQGSESKGRIAAVLGDGSVNIYTTSFIASSVLRKTHLSDGIHGRRTISVDRIHDSRNNGTKHTGLELMVNPLCTYNVNRLDLGSQTGLRYVRAKWINPAVLVLLTRSPFLDHEFVLGKRHSTQSEIVLAQVWTVAEVLPEDPADRIESTGKIGGWESAPSFGANIALVSEVKVPCGDDSLDELVHDTFSLPHEEHRAAFNGNRDGEACTGPPGASVFTKCGVGMSILYRHSTDCITINSQAVTIPPASAGVALKVRPMSLIWDWKRNVRGLTLASHQSYCVYQYPHRDHAQAAPSLLSWFQLGYDDSHGLCALHVYEQNPTGKTRRARKDIYSLSILTPRNSFAENGCLSVNDPCAILLHHDSVTFPVLDQPINTKEVSLKWEEFRVPSSYVASNGPCQIAAVGKDHGRSIAVAASRGLCVLDLSRLQQVGNEELSLAHHFQSQSPRWKMFSNVNDEQRFRVVSMIWWETASEDFLLAAVHYAATDPVHLVCWSRKSIGFGDDQLLKEPTTVEDNGGSKVTPDGVALPLGFRAHKMSIVVDPDGSSTRALLLIAQVAAHNGASSCVKYVLYQLQAVQSLSGKHEQVLVRDSASGTIPMQIGKSPDFSATDTITGIFLAGGSFLFDLERETETLDSPNDGTQAIVGILTLFQGLVAVCISQSAPTLYRPSLLEHTTIGECHFGSAKGLVATYWVSGTASSKDGCRIAWSIALNNGKVYCWSVPCNTFEAVGDARLHCERNGEWCSRLLERHSILGEVCRLGSSSLWMNGATTSDGEVAMGPFCPLAFGCTLYAGQRSRRNAGPRGMTSFHANNCVVAPPQFTPFLFSSFLALSLSNLFDSGRQVVNGSGGDASKRHESGSCNEFARYCITSTLHRVHNLGSCRSALRVITLKVIEILNDTKTVSDQCAESVKQGDVSQDKLRMVQEWRVGTALLNNIVSVVQQMFDVLGFATFFLSVGRQLEPPQYNLLFPLPVELHGSPLPRLCTAEDLFTASCDNGSLATALSALPLFSSHKESQQCVTRLIYHCLLKIEENSQSCASDTALTAVDDESFLHQLFWFGVKLEDAIEIEDSYVDSSGSSDDESSCDDESSFDSCESSVESSPEANATKSTFDEDIDEFVNVSSSVRSLGDDYTFDTYSSDESQEVSFISSCRTPRPKPTRDGLVKKVVKRLFRTANPDDTNNSIEEGEIYDAASSFILSGFDDDLPAKSPAQALHASAQDDEEELDDDDLISEPEIVDGNSILSDETHPRNLLVLPTVAGSVCTFIYRMIAINGSYEGEMGAPHYGWRAVHVVAHVLLGDRQTSAITSAGSENAQGISRMLTVREFLSATSVGYGSHSVDASDNAASEQVAGALAKLTQKCCQQLQGAAFDTVFNLILLLLLRYEACRDVQHSRVILIAVGIISGHLSGRIDELLDLSTSCDVIHIYLTYATKLGSVASDLIT